MRIFIDLSALIFDMHDINTLFLCNILYFNAIFSVCWKQGDDSNQSYLFVYSVLFIEHVVISGMSLKTRFYKYSEMFMDWGNCIQTRYVVVQNIYATYLVLSLCLLHLGFCVQNILLSSNFNKYSCLPYFFRMYHDLGSVWTWPLMRLSKKWFENGGWDTDERVGFC